MSLEPQRQGTYHTPWTILTSMLKFGSLNGELLCVRFSQTMHHRAATLKTACKVKNPSVLQ